LLCGCALSLSSAQVAGQTVTPAPAAPAVNPTLPPPPTSPAPPYPYYPPGYTTPPSPYGYPPAYYAPPSYLQPPSPPEPPFVHDGFYLRMGIGVGYGHVSISSGGETTTMSGLSEAITFALGGAIAPNLILYGGLVNTSIRKPKYALDGTTVQEEGSSILTTGFGPGLAYYFMPSNAYLAGTLMLSRLSQAAPRGSNALSEWGPGGEVLLGKEWWVSPNWGLGLVAQIVGARPVAKEISGASFKVIEAALLFSATYN
jgi:hypothetical protein